MMVKFFQGSMPLDAPRLLQGYCLLYLSSLTRAVHTMNAIFYLLRVAGNILHHIAHTLFILKTNKGWTAPDRVKWSLSSFCGICSPLVPQESQTWGNSHAITQSLRYHHESFRMRLWRHTIRSHDKLIPTLFHGRWYWYQVSHAMAYIAIESGNIKDGG